MRTMQGYRRACLWWAMGIALAFGGCASAEADLAIAHRLYRDARYEAAERWLEEVEPDAARLAAGDRARFYYLRGMCAYRLGQREDARHYLVLGSRLLARDASAVDAEGRAALQRALSDLLREPGV
ncbi:MAG: hypothetical protein OXR73_02215 [Myxococcales bacterium]|nr:hypothetical protein [Myxococcales bacterium]